VTSVRRFAELESERENLRLVGCVSGTAFLEVCGVLAMLTGNDADMPTPNVGPHQESKRWMLMLIELTRL
jgi:hypothetical protein